MLYALPGNKRVAKPRSQAVEWLQCNDGVEGFFSRSFVGNPGRAKSSCWKEKGDKGLSKNASQSRHNLSCCSECSGGMNQMPEKKLSTLYLRINPCQLNMLTHQGVKLILFV